MTPIAQLTQLRRIEAERTPIQDVSPLKDLVNLERRHIHDTQVTDISSLQHLVDKGLDIQGLASALVQPTPSQTP